jgi:K+-transporting ATPase ATPase C chain
MGNKADGSIVKVNGQPVGSSLIGQNFTDGDGNPIEKYFQPRPSAAGDGYDGLSSAGSQYGPSNANLIGKVPGVNLDEATNPYASPADPYCVPVQQTDDSDEAVTDAKGDPVYEKNDDGTYVCDPNTVPQRAMAYRALNGLADDAKVPVDAVTASGSGLDPAISVENANLQAQRVAEARGLDIAVVQQAIRDHTSTRQLGFLGEDAVNVLELNLALDATG